MEGRDNMAPNVTANGSSFRIKRPLITTNGFVSDVDTTVKGHLDELNQILGRRIFQREMLPPVTVEDFVGEVLEDIHGASEQAEQDDALINAYPSERSSMPSRIGYLLRSPLTPKRIPGNSWAQGSLVYRFKQAPESPDNLTLSDYIDATPELSSLKYEFQSSMSSNWFNLDFNSRTVLEGYGAITDYLVAYAYFVMGLRDVNGLKNFVLNNPAGARNVANYAAVSAARSYIDRKQLKVSQYNEDDSEIVRDIRAKGISLSAVSFETTLQSVLDDFVFNSDEDRLIEAAVKAGMKPVSPETRLLLIKFINESPIPITTQNAKFYLPVFLSQLRGTAAFTETGTIPIEVSDKDFDVEFLEDTDERLQISRSAVKCAAQLYYSMILGDELDVFTAINYFTHNYLVRGAVEIQDRRLREDLQQYVFSNKFTDLKTKQLVDRTRPAERHMFYRQVFNYGNAPVTESVIVNDQFPRLWKVLILESARYLERAQASLNPDSYVSRQNVMQAVEDLQYNLSTHCTGMANVITPLIYSELDFVIRRIFMNDEILDQVVPRGGTWWRVVETLYASMRRARPKATVLYNKAKLGHEILRSIADYNPTTFEDDRNFSAFISNVDAFITTQSILQESLTDDLKKYDEEEGPGPNGYSANGYSANGKAGAGPGLYLNDAPAPAAAPAGNDEWDF
jgi:hypothetical protein